MEKGRLTADQIVLVHHVELADAGWQERLADQLVLASALSSDQPVTLETIRASLLSIGGAALGPDRVDASIRRLTGSRRLHEVSVGCYVPSQAARSEAEARRQQAAMDEAAARATFESLIKTEAPGFAAGSPWSWFCDSCLQAIVNTLGARTYELLTLADTADESTTRVVAFLTSVPPELKKGVHRAVQRFLASTDLAVRRFVLLHLHAHFLGLAASLPPESLDALQKLVHSHIQLRVFLDTNFLFSLLDLHENPANEAAQELVRLLQLIKGHVSVTLYVTPLTVDESRRTLAFYETKLSDMNLTSRLGRVARVLDGELSGLSLRYLSAVRKAKHRLSAKEYFEPYLTNLVGFLRAKGIELYNENTEGLSKTQPVIDDILEQQQFEKTHFPDRTKPYEALRHDMTLWHLAVQRRPKSLDAPLDAIYWVVTVDYRLLGFDAHKRRLTNCLVPVCVHPTVLVQMLQLWLPRTPEFESALFESLRALLPQFFDSEAEEMSLRILRALSRFEDVDDLPEETITSLLLNRALRHRMVGEGDIGEQIALIRDAIVEEAAVTHRALDAEQARGDALAKELERLTNEAGQMQASSDLKERQAEAQRLALEQELIGERKKRTTLESRLSSLEAAMVKQEQQRAIATLALARDRDRQRFAILMLLLSVVLGVGVWFGASEVNREFGFPITKARILAGLLALGLWLTVMLLVGRAREAIRSWPVFQKADRAILVLGSTAWALGLGLLTNLIWEVWTRP